MGGTMVAYLDGWRRSACPNLSFLYLEIGGWLFSEKQRKRCSLSGGVVKARNVHPRLKPYLAGDLLKMMLQVGSPLVG